MFVVVDIVEVSVVDVVCVCRWRCCVVVAEVVVMCVVIGRA